MKYIVVDKDEKILKDIKEQLKSVYPDAEIKLFLDPLLAFQYAFFNQVETAYINVAIKRIDGFELSKMLLSIKEKPRVILMDEKKESRKDALRIGATGFLMKPVTTEKIKLCETGEW